MTATVTDEDVLKDLDFEPVVPCDIGECGRKDPEPAIQVLALPFKCELEKRPICCRHSEMAAKWKRDHVRIECPCGEHVVCGEYTWFEPL